MSGWAKVEYYRTKSVEAERSAAAAKDPAVKQRFVKIAEHWRALAEDTQGPRCATGAASAMNCVSLGGTRFEPKSVRSYNVPDA